MVDQRVLGGWLRVGLGQALGLVLAGAGAVGCSSESDAAGGAGGVGVAGATGAAGFAAAGVTGAAGSSVGAAGTVGAAGSTGAAGTAATDGGVISDAGNVGGLPKFSFFVTSYAAIKRTAMAFDPSLTDGFGGDLRYGQADGLAGADKICSTIAEYAMPGAGQKTWRAFLSATKGADGNQVNAIDRIGEGPWYDRLGRVLAPTKADLMDTRPMNGDATIKDDFPNEDGVPNHDPDNTGEVDNHDMLTGTNKDGQLYVRADGTSATCDDWESAAASAGKPRVGHSWPRTFGGFPGFDAGAGFPIGGGMGGGGAMGDWDMAHWMSSLDESGCEPGAYLKDDTAPSQTLHTVGSGGGYGGFYCFALTP